MKMRNRPASIIRQRLVPDRFPADHRPRPVVGVGPGGTLRMVFEAWLQLRRQAPPERQIATVEDRHLALTHNLGGYPGEMVSFVSILGTALA